MSNSLKITAMKLLYILVALFALLFSGYMIANDFSFDHISFSNYLINTLFIMLLCCIGVVGLVAAVSYKRKHADKDVMTIRQYYQYRSAR
jgi:uncharacterized membrane protein HdeD (DUF308 family)